MAELADTVQLQWHTDQLWADHDGFNSECRGDQLLHLYSLDQRCSDGAGEEGVGKY
jgi:hypothetical protein